MARYIKPLKRKESWINQDSLKLSEYYQTSFFLIYFYINLLGIFVIIFYQHNIPISIEMTNTQNVFLLLQYNIPSLLEATRICTFLPMQPLVWITLL